MGKTKGMQASMKRYRSAVPAILALGLVMPVASQAQEASPGSFSLPPGPQSEQQAPTDVQGPVDSESAPPRRTDQPVEQAPADVVPRIAPVPVPVPVPVPQQDAPRQRARPEAPRDDQPARNPVQQPRTQPESAPAETAPDVPDADPGLALPVPAPAPFPGPELADPPVVAPETQDTADAPDGSIWWWLAAGLVALISLVVMGLRQRTRAAKSPVAAISPEASADTVPTPPLRSPPVVSTAAPAAPSAPDAPKPVPSAPFGTIQASGLTFAAAPTRTPAAPPAPTPAPAPAPVAGDASVPAQSQPSVAASAPMAAATPPVSADAVAGQAPRLLLDFTTLGVDVTLVNAVARYHLGVTNLADIQVSDVVLHGAVVQARRGMPPTVDPMRGESLLPLLQKIDDIAPDGTQRCEGQIRLPLDQIDPIEMQGRLLFVPVVHIWIGYSGPDGTRYAVTQSFVLGEESSPPGPRVGPLRLDLGPRRFTEVGQRPLQPA